MTPEQLKAQIEEWRNHPLIGGSGMEFHRALVALFDRMEAQQKVIDVLVAAAPPPPVG